MTTECADFIGEVQHRIDAGTQAEAVGTTRTVLETLGERVEEGGATDVASPLLLEIDRYLPQVEHGHTYDLDEFEELVEAETQPWEQSDWSTVLPGFAVPFYSRSIRRPESADS